MKFISNLTLLGLILFSFPAISGEIKYPISEIPEELLKDANGVLRLDETEFTLKSIKEGTLRRKYAITILNKKMEDWASIQLVYSDIIDISKIEGTLYDAYGNEVRSLKKKDFKDQSATGGGTFVGDYRVIFADLLYNQFPYTVEFEYEKDYDELYQYESWDPVPENYLAVMNSSYKLVFPKDIEVRINEKYLRKDRKEFIQGDNQVYLWEEGNIQSVLPEDLYNDYELPQVEIAPGKFYYGGYEGDFSSWKSYGIWYNNLLKGRDELSETTRTKIREMVKDAQSDEEKVKIIYEYLQSKTRYVSIQLGIGGLQPFEASFVDEKGYGDCKALSNYTLAMLKAVGITSYFTVIYGGKYAPKVKEDFPMDKFNHVILCVPLEKDTIWLECTSQTEAFGYQGGFTDDRKAVIIKPDGAELVHTSVIKKDENLQIRSAEVFIDEKGNASASLKNTYKALQEGKRKFVAELPKEDQKKWLYENLDISNYEIQQFSMNRVKSKIPETHVSLDINIRKCASINGKRLFLKPNLLTKMSWIPESLEERKTEIELNRFYDFIDHDTVVYHLPENFHVEYNPEKIQYESQFGKYEASITVDKNKVTYIRRMEMNQGIYPKESYGELRKFLKDVVKADKTKMVFVNKT
ncbi:DUF3857 domain-containing transglutaminase family protein [Flexithrix dorotheae]|uniref:DUF3857 domain-containing transglutaminase family protein n=1 Tax=Flexithrix dorotheae TaxID=70993 RepID=UPI00035ED373|nr:DUF3857 domain-containing transglutaminase family protein [Flexithrix dorotheae]